MTSTLSGARARTDRLVLVQAHCTALGLGGALLLVVSARRLGRIPDAPDAWSIPLVAAASLAAIAGVSPWLVPRLGVHTQRLLTIAALATGTVGVLGSVWIVDLLALLGLQLILTAAVLAEVGLQRRALTWLWICGLLLVAAVLVYHQLVDLQPRPE